ncbi:MAG: sugar ABC transporter ATP-binding protein [Verrucomicrobiales bacterium]|nr:sugar ABC transporter ATP-binding protein [Verrucomicrobiales bacterium]MCP5527421.1 sugar ABC transporter ATP-binding protein [Verrucomicrobiales bacterium]
MPRCEDRAGAVRVLARLSGITKRFGPVTVLEGVDLEVRAGEVHILAGENGAGKSTLIKILGGVHADFEGTIEVDGRPVRPASPLAAAALGVVVIFQELSLVPAMTVTDNIFLGRPRTRAGFVDDARQRAEAREILDRLGIDLEVDRRVEELPIAQQQLTEIAKALAQEARVIVMDEPTSALNAPEVAKLFTLIRQLKERGCGIVYITHKMEEIAAVADRITVLRDGRLVGTAPAVALPPGRLIQWMVGRELGEQFPRHDVTPGAERLRLERFSVPDPQQPGAFRVRDVSLTLRAGEILGIAGLQGSGASDLLLGLFGAHGRRVQGGVRLDGEPFAPRHPTASITRGIALLTNDRKASGLVLPLSIAANTTLADLPALSPGGWRRPARERRVTEAHGRRLNLRAAGIEQEVGSLSGGNQQKVVLAKWLQTRPRLLLLDEPTRGVDVGAKREIYALLDALTAEGIAILLITSELPELLALADRILVLHRGRATAEFPRGEASAEGVLQAAMGQSPVDRS